MKIETDILLLLEGCELSGNSLKITQQLDRNTYVKLNKVIEACGGKWDKKSKAHIFPQNSSDRIEQVLLTGEVEIPKDEFDFFPTPKAIVDKMVEEADIGLKDNVLEPSAGKGAILDGILRKTCQSPTAYELNKDCFDFLKKEYQDKVVVYQADFLEVEPKPVFDKVVMNPPFSKQQDIKHVLHAYKFLKSGGKLVAIMSGSFTFRENKLSTEFRNFVEENGDYERLPEKSFKESGTSVNTVMVILNKRS